MTSELRKTGISVVGDVPWAHTSVLSTRQNKTAGHFDSLFQDRTGKQGVLSLVISNSELLTVEEAGALCEVLFRP